MDYDQVFPKLWVGSCPGRTEDIDHLIQDTRVSAMLNLVTDEDVRRLGSDLPLLLVHSSRRGVEVRRFPITDGDTEDLRTKLPAAVRLLDGLLAAGHSVYLHCIAGIERSPSVAIAHMHWCMGYELQEAADYMDRRRGCSPDLEAIALATRDLLRGEAIRARIERKAIETSGGVVEDTAWRAAVKHVLRELITELEPL